ncbi:MAG: amino-acid N-acetyltransferase [Dermatophilus congolensis]|nr:amino-acid N-acetyltransferase [Dermatophilus congolensis]
MAMQHGEAGASRGSALRVKTSSAAQDTSTPAHKQFVTWMRQVAPYIHAFRDSTLVVAIPGELIEAGRLNALVQDLALLGALGMKIVVINGCRPQIDEQLHLRGYEPEFLNRRRRTDHVALECAKEVAGEIRLDMEAAFSQGLPNTPMAHSAMRVVSGNYVQARPIGIVDGVDFQYSGNVRRVDTEAIRAALDAGAVVLLSNIGFSPTGEAFNLQMEDVAVATAVALGADKLVYLMETDGLVDEQGRVLTEVSEAQVEATLAGGVDDPMRLYLECALAACRGGVPRTHLLPYAVDGQVLLEFFLHDGIGTMLVQQSLEDLRVAVAEDVPAILSIIRPLEESGALVKRDRALIESEIENFSVVEHDRVIFGCAALYPFPAERMGEMACVAVSPHSQGRGDGEVLLLHIELRARALGLTRLFVLTTQTTHWFLRHGFVPASVDDLPSTKQGMYNFQRRSRVLIKDL